MNDEIMVRLGLNSSAFQEGMKSATRATEGFQSKLMGPLNAVKGFGAALGGAFALNTLQGITDHAEKLRNLAEGLNVSTTELQKWQNAMEFAGVSGETSTKALTKFTSKLSSAASGSGEVAEAFANMGIAVQDAGGNARGTMEILGDVADMFATMEDKSQRSRIAVELFGKQGLKMVAALSQGREEMERTGNLKHIISPEALESLDQMGDDLKEIFDGFKGVGASAVSLLAGPLRFFKEYWGGTRDAISGAMEAAATMAQLKPTQWGSVFTMPESDLKTDFQRQKAQLDLRQRQIEAVSKVVKASKEQKEFDEQQFKSAMARSDEAGKLYLLQGKQRDIADQIAKLEKIDEPNVAKEKKLLALKIQASQIGMDLEKAREAVEADATKKKIEAYNNIVERQERLNSLVEKEGALRAGINAILDKFTKVGIEDIAKRTITDATAKDEREAILKAQEVVKVKTEREAEQKAQAEGVAPLDPQKLQRLFDKEMALRGKLSPKFFREEDIRPQGDIAEKLKEASADVQRERWQQAQDAINEAEKQQGKALTKFQAGLILQKFGASATAEDMRLFPVSNAPKNIGEDESEIIGRLISNAEKIEKLIVEGAARVHRSGTPEQMREFEELLRISTEMAWNPKESKTISKLDENIGEHESQIVGRMISNAEKIEKLIVEGAERVPWATGKEAEIAFQEMLNGTMSADNSETISKLDEIHAALTQPLKVKPVNGP